MLNGGFSSGGRPIGGSGGKRGGSHSGGALSGKEGISGGGSSGGGGFGVSTGSGGANEGVVGIGGGSKGVVEVGGTAFPAIDGKRCPKVVRMLTAVSRSSDAADGSTCPGSRLMSVIAGVDTRSHSGSVFTALRTTGSGCTEGARICSGSFCSAIWGTAMAVGSFC